MIGSRHLLIALTALALLTSGCAGCRTSQGAADREHLCREFVFSAMTTPEGAVLTSAPVSEPVIGPRTPDRAAMEASGVLSESVGLLMLYAVESNDRETFDRQFSLLQAKMLSAKGLVYWKLSADLDLVANASASVDDLRIAYALLRAHEAWNDGRYLDQAIDLATNVREWTTTDGGMRDFLNWRDYGEPTLADTASLCYLDLPAMKALAAVDPDWEAVYERSRALIENGRTAAGLYPETYRYSSDSYEGYTINTIHLALIGYYLAASEPPDRGVLDFLRTKLDEDDAVYAEYDARTGEPTQFFESTSVYAIAALMAHAVGDDALTQRFVSRMNRFQVLDAGSPMNGAYSDDEVYSFDNLLALLALQAATRAGGDGSRRAEP